MNLLELEKATKIYEKIKVIDSEISEIDNFAMLVANGNMEPFFILSIKDHSKEQSSPTVDDTTAPMHGFFEQMMGMGAFFIPRYPVSHEHTEKETKERFIKYELSDSSTLQILGILLYEKRSQRQMLLSELEKLELRK